MADNLVIFGHTYNGVEGFKATDTNNNEITYTPGGSAPVLKTLQLSYLPTESLISDTETPPQGYDGFDEVQVTVSAIPSSYVGSGVSRQAAQAIHPSTSDQSIAANQYLTGAQTIKGVLLTNLLAGNIKKDVVVKIGDSSDDDCVTSVTGTYEGGSTGKKYSTGTYTPTATTTTTGNVLITTIATIGFTPKVFVLAVTNKSNVQGLGTVLVSTVYFVSGGNDEFRFTGRYSNTSNSFGGTMYIGAWTTQQGNALYLNNGNIYYRASTNYRLIKDVEYTWYAYE